MSKAFTHYWRNSTWQDNRELEGKLLTHLSSNFLVNRGVEAGDSLYVVTIQMGHLFLSGKMIVEIITDASQAARGLNCQPSDLWPARDHALASQATPMRFGKIVPHEVVRKLLFRTRNGDFSPLKYAAPDELDRQTLRHVRELSLQSAQELDAFVLPLQKFAASALRSPKR